MVSFSIIATLAMALAATAAPAAAPEPIEISTSVADVADGLLSANWVGSASWYEPGLGSCGKYSSGGEYVVAMSQYYVGPRARISSCGRRVHIVHGNREIDATVVDVCMGCRDADLDVSPAAFKALFGDLGVGRGPITWSFN